MNQFKTFTISSQEPKAEFECTNPNSGINIHKIEIPFLAQLPISTWLVYLSEVSIKFTEIASTGYTNSFIQPINLDPYSQHPIFEVDIFVPSSNKNNYSAVTPFYNKFEVELIAPGKTKELTMYIIYEEFPDVNRI